MTLHNTEINVTGSKSEGWSFAGGVVAYALLIVGAIGAFVLVNQLGAAGTSRDAPIASPPSLHTGIFVHVLITLAVVVLACQLLGRVFRYFGQPAVIGEVVAGILLGPSLLGRVWPEAAAFVLPTEVGPFIGVIAQLGVVLYMFLVGLELNLSTLQTKAASTLAISHASIALPFVAGAALALYLYPDYSQGHTSFTSFALFMGIALSVTAFPVLARILTDRHMQRTPLGVTALGAAAIGDVTAWCFLACIVGVARESMSEAVVTTILTGLFITAMIFFVKPLVTYYLGKLGTAPLTPTITAMGIAAILVAALVTETIGIHALFGAFMLGVIIPHDNHLAGALRNKLEDVVSVLLLPTFFAAVGMRTEMGLVSGWQNWLICGLIILVATMGKFSGTFVAARMTGHDTRHAAGLGVLMNTRGLMELIVLNIGLEMNVISPTLFTMMVLMALATTFFTGPALILLGFGRGGVVREGNGMPLHSPTHISVA